MVVVLWPKRRYIGVESRDYVIVESKVAGKKFGVYGTDKIKSEGRIRR